MIAWIILSEWVWEHDGMIDCDFYSVSLYLFSFSPSMCDIIVVKGTIDLYVCDEICILGNLGVYREKLIAKHTLCDYGCLKGVWKKKRSKRRFDLGTHTHTHNKSLKLELDFVQIAHDEDDDEWHIKAFCYV